MPEQTKSASRIQFQLALVLAVVAFAVYANTLGNGFAYDDLVAITHNKIVMKGAPGITELLTTPYQLGYSPAPKNLYRPLSLVLFAAEHSLGGNDPFIGHLGNVLLFAGCVVLLFLFADRFLDRKNTPAAFIAALLFAVLPVHTEVVANVKSADELLCFLFAFLALNAFLRYSDTGKPPAFISGLLFFFLSMMSKETGVTYFGVICLLFIFFHDKSRKRTGYIISGALVCVLLFLYARWSVLSAYNISNDIHISAIDNMLASPDISTASRMATAVLILGRYLWLLVIPYPLICDYSYNTIPITGPGNALVIISALVYLFLIAYAVRGISGRRRDPYAFAILLFLITISVVSNVFFLIGTTMGERLIFSGSAGFCIAAALLISKLSGPLRTAGSVSLRNWKMLSILVPLCVVYGYISFARNRDWKDSMTLFYADVAKAPNSARLNFCLGLEIELSLADATNAQDVAARRSEGIAYLQRAVEIDPGYTEANAALGTAFAVANRLDSAEVHLRRALKNDPYDIKTLNNMTSIYWSTGRYRQAISLSTDALKIDPSFIGLYCTLSKCYQALGKNDSAVYILHRAIQVNGSDPAPYISLGDYYRSAGHNDTASACYAMARKRSGR